MFIDGRQEETAGSEGGSCLRRGYLEGELWQWPDRGGATVQHRYPGAGSAYGAEARAALAAMVLNKSVRIEQTARDRYGRIVGRVFRGRTFVNEEMVRHGHAWVYHDYSREPEFARLEERARRARQGLWALPKAKRVPPWEWRKLGKGKARPVEKGWKVWPWLLAMLVAGVLAGGAYLWMTGRLDISRWIPDAIFRFLSAGQAHLSALLSLR